MRAGIKIEGSKVFITGGASGIGYATAARMASERAIPILLDINQAGLDEALESLRADGFEAYGFRANVADIDGVRELRDELEGKGLLPEILINCAGLTLMAHVCSMDHEEWSRIIDVNIMGTINTIDTFLPAMIERQQGHIVNIGSIAGLLPIPGLSAYCGSKFAITGLTEALRFDLRHCGIGVSLVCPGYVNTPMARAHPIKDLPVRFQGWEIVSRLTEIFSSSAESVARHIVHAIEHNKRIVIPGWPSRVFYQYRRLFPGLASSSGVAVGRLYNWLRKRSYTPVVQSIGN